MKISFRYKFDLVQTNKNDFALAVHKNFTIAFLEKMLLLFVMNQAKRQLNPQTNKTVIVFFHLHETMKYIQKIFLYIYFEKT